MQRIKENTMANMNERGKSFEAEYIRNQERVFRITARRNYLFGLWAAAKMGLAEGEAYAKAVIAADLEAPGDDDVIAKVRDDLAAKGIVVAGDELRAELARAFAEAQRQVLALDASSGTTST
jgi:hypothetical protein